jgi:hypothetical protein
MSPRSHRIRVHEYMSIFQNVLVPADGTTATTVRNGDFGTSPFFEQLSHKPRLPCVYLCGRLARAPRPKLPRRRRPSARCRRSSHKEIGRRRGQKLVPDSARPSAPPRARGIAKRMVNAMPVLQIAPLGRGYPLAERNRNFPSHQRGISSAALFAGSCADRIVKTDWRAI